MPSQDSFYVNHCLLKAILTAQFYWGAQIKKNWAKTDAKPWLYKILTGMGDNVSFQATATCGKMGHRPKPKRKFYGLQLPATCLQAGSCPSKLDCLGLLFAVCQLKLWNGLEIYAGVRYPWIRQREWDRRNGCHFGLICSSTVYSCNYV